jgi:hypothetical protein
MVKTAKIMIIIGFILGGFGAIMQVGSFIFAKPLSEFMQQAAVQQPDAYAPLVEAFQKGTERTLPNILSTFGNLILVAAGGMLGLLAVSAGARNTAVLVYGIATAACGVGLLLTRSWICAAAYIIGGFLLILESNKEETQAGAPEEGMPLKTDAPPQ